MSPIFLLILVFSLALFTSGLLPLSTSALLGSLLTLWFGIQQGLFSYEVVFDFVNWRVVGLLFGTMVLIKVIERSGLFKYFALQVLRFCKKPALLFFGLCFFAALSAFLVVEEASFLLVAALVISLSKGLGLNSLPYLLSVAFMTSIAGTSSLIGSVSNMVIGIEAGLSFTDFLIYLLPAELCMWGLTMGALYLFYRNRLSPIQNWDKLKPIEPIEDLTLFRIGCMLLLLFLVLMLVHGLLGIGAETVALGVAILALVLSGFDPQRIFSKLDWDVIFTLIGLSIVIKGIEASGLLNGLVVLLGNWLTGASQLLSTFILWSSAGLSAVLNKLNTSLLLVPVIKQMEAGLPAVWAALVLGTNIGGKILPISGAEILLAYTILRKEGFKNVFKEFMRAALLITGLQLSFATAYLLLWFGV